MLERLSDVAEDVSAEDVFNRIYEFGKVVKERYGETHQKLAFVAAARALSFMFSAPEGVVLIGDYNPESGAGSSHDFSDLRVGIPIECHVFRELSIAEASSIAGQEHLDRLRMILEVYKKPECVRLKEGIMLDLRLPSMRRSGGSCHYPIEQALPYHQAVTNLLSLGY